MIPDLGHCVYCFKSLLEVVSSTDKEHDEGDYSSNCSRTKMTLNVMIHLTRPKGSKLSRGAFNYDNTTSLMWTLWSTDMSHLMIQDKTEFKWRFLKASNFYWSQIYWNRIKHVVQILGLGMRILQIGFDPDSSWKACLVESVRSLPR